MVTMASPMHFTHSRKTTHLHVFSNTSVPLLHVSFLIYVLLRTHGRLNTPVDSSLIKYRLTLFSYHISIIYHRDKHKFPPLSTPSWTVILQHSISCIPIHLPHWHDCFAIYSADITPGHVHHILTQATRYHIFPCRAWYTVNHGLHFTYYLF